MGVYLSEVTFQQWSGPLLRLGSALDFALADRNLQPYMPEPHLAERVFEEKLIPPMDDFGDLCDQQLRGDLSCLDWDLLIPVDFDGAIELPIPSNYSNITTTTRSAYRLLSAMQIMTRQVSLPDDVPTEPTGMALTTWFIKATQPNGAAHRWQHDPAVIFYTALFLRTAERALGQDCAIQMA